MTTVFILSGFNMHPTPGSHWYGQLREGLEAKGYRVVPVDIPWKHTTPSQYAADFTTLYQKQKTESNIVVGNSFGAVIAFMAAKNTRPDKLYLCSLSAFFKEDRPKRADEFGLRYFGKRRMKDLWSISADELAARVLTQRLSSCTAKKSTRPHHSSSTAAPRLQERYPVLL